MIFLVLTSRHSLNENNVTRRTVYRMFFNGLKICDPSSLYTETKKPKKKLKKQKKLEFFFQKT